MTSVCVVGAGAVGGTIGARLAAAGLPTSALARGATLTALREHGWRLRSADGELVAPVRASSDPDQLGEHDVVVIAVKGQSLDGLAPTLGPLVGPDTTVLAALNGIPWWFFAGIGDAAQGISLPAVDPTGAIAQVLPPERTVGGVVHFSASTPDPGVAVLNAGNRLVVGDAVPGGDRAASLGSLLGTAGFDTEVVPRIHDAAWFKLWGNLTMNPLSVITGATSDRILDDELVAQFVRSAMTEAMAIGDAIGCPVDQTVDERFAVTRQLGAMRTSMLQDAAAGRSIELDPLVTAVAQLGRRMNVPTPTIDALLGLARLWGRVHGAYPD
ncbi:2-dehydropantoate 2-reductase [Spongisporangium articulatum]|uniref:2-dehydropantoate 2-reductase n=1 Tax=Spongisporangium articulatum TaxID=3362603 RepID=A0ABW8AGV0_9ACTN